MKKFFTFLCLFTSAAFANYTGIWVGEGVLSNTKGQAWYCDEVVVIVDQKEDRFEFGRFRYGCGELAFTFVPPVLNFDTNKNTTWKDQNIGKFDETNVDFLFKLQKEGDYAKYTVRVNGNEMDYQDDQIAPDRTLTLKAKLYKKQ